MGRISNPLLNAADMDMDLADDDEGGVPGSSPVTKLILVPPSSAAAAVEGETVFAKVLGNPAVTVVELVLIFATIGTLAFDSPYDPPTEVQRSVIALIELLSSAIWTVFLVTNIGVKGWHCYVYDDDTRRLQLFNILDFVVVGGSWLSYIPWVKHGYRLIRLLRLVRLIPVMRGQAVSLRMILDSLFWSLPMLRDVMIFIIFILLAYSTVLLHVYEGTMSHRCVVPRNITESPCSDVVNMHDCLPPACAWNGLRGCIDNSQSQLAPLECPSTLKCPDGGTLCMEIPAILVADKEDYGYFGFDNLAQTGLTVFAQIALDGGFHDLPYLMQKTDAGAAVIVWPLFASIVVVVNLLVMNLFVAIVVSSFQSTHAVAASSNAEEQQNAAVMNSSMAADSPELREKRLETMLAAAALEDDVPDYLPGRRAQLERMIATSPFEFTVLAAIALNVCVLCSYHYGASDSLLTLLAILEICFLFFFAVEAAIKLFALGVKKYLQSALNALDFAVLIVSLVGIVVNAVVGEAVGGFSALRVLRLSRLIGLARVAYRYESVRHVLSTAFKSASDLVALCAVIVFCLIFASLAGMHLFGGRCETCTGVSTRYIYSKSDPEYYTMYPRRNYETFTAAMISTFQHLTNDGWSQIMFWYMEHTSSSAFVFFMFTYVLTYYVLVSLFVAIIMQNFGLDAKTKLSRQIENYTRYISKKSKQTTGKAKDGEELVASAKQLKSLNMFAPDNGFRLLCKKITHHPAYDWGMCAVVLYACGIVAYEGAPGSLPEGTQNFVDISNLIVYFMFFSEALMKSIGNGFWYKPPGKLVSRPYFRRSANRLDFAIVILIGFSYLVKIAYPGPSFVGSLGKGMRALQPLRVLNRFKGLQRISGTLIESLPGVAAVFGLLILFWLCFGIIGVEAFAGTLYRCVDCNDTYSLQDSGIENKAQCLAAEFCWENPPFNFDNIFNAMEALYQASTMVGWIDIMESCADAQGIDLQPKAWANGTSSIVYFICFNVVVNLFLMKLFVGVMAASFSNACGTSLTTEHQKRWVRLQRMVEEFNPKPKYKAPDAETMNAALFAVQSRCFVIAQHSVFKQFIDFCIVLNLTGLAVEHYPHSETFGAVVAASNSIFLVIFTLELLFKVIAYGFKGYWHDQWNILDALVVTTSLAGRFLGVKSGAEIGRVFRTMRVFLVFNRIQGLTELFSTLLAVLPSAFYIMVLIVLIFFVYAILGMQTFGLEPTDHVYYNADNNFSDFPHAMRLLFQMTVGQSITLISHDLRAYGNHGVFMFFASFYFFSSYMMMNLFVGILVDTFDLQHTPHVSEDDPDAVDFSVDDIEMANRNPGQLELPYDALQPFLFDLCLRETANETRSGAVDPVLHVKPSNPDWMYYTLLQAELYAYRIKRGTRVPGLSLAKAMASFKPDAEGEGGAGKKAVGLNFYTMMERLLLDRIGKSTLSYQQQMEEQDTEESFVATNTLTAMISAKVRQKRGKNHEGYPSPKDEPAWANCSDETFAVAVAAVRDMRITRLSRLRLIVQAHSTKRLHELVNPVTGSPGPSPRVNVETGSPLYSVANKNGSSPVVGVGGTTPSSGPVRMVNPMLAELAEEEDED